MIVPEREKGRRVDFKKMQGVFWKILLVGWKWTAGCFWQKSEGCFFENFVEREGWTAGFISRKVEVFL